MKNEVEVADEVDIDLSDLEVTEGVEIAEDPIETEIKAKTAKAKKAPKAAKEKVAKEPKEPKEAKPKALAADEIGAAAVAEMCDVDGRTLRMFLRKNYRDMESDKAKRYVWKKTDPQVQEIVDAFKADKAAVKTRKVAAPAEAAK